MGAQAMAFTLQTVAEGKIRSISAACTRKSAYGNAAEPFPHFTRKPPKNASPAWPSASRFPVLSPGFSRPCFGHNKKGALYNCILQRARLCSFPASPYHQAAFRRMDTILNAFASFPALSKGFCCAHKRALQQHIGKLWKGCRQCLCMFGWFIFHRIGSRLNACGFSRRFHWKLLFAFRGSHFAQAFL